MKLLPQFDYSKENLLGFLYAELPKVTSVSELAEVAEAQTRAKKIAELSQQQMLSGISQWNRDGLEAAAETALFSVSSALPERTHSPEFTYLYDYLWLSVYFIKVRTAVRMAFAKKQIVTFADVITVILHTQSVPLAEYEQLFEAVFTQDTLPQECTLTTVEQLLDAVAFQLTISEIASVKDPFLQQWMQLQALGIILQIETRTSQRITTYISVPEGYENSESIFEALIADAQQGTEWIFMPLTQYVALNTQNSPREIEAKMQSVSAAFLAEHAYFGNGFIETIAYLAKVRKLFQVVTYMLEHERATKQSVLKVFGEQA